MKLLAGIAAVLLATAAPAQQRPADPLKGTVASSGLLTVHVDRQGGRILLELPPAGADGLIGRYLYVASLRTGVGSAPIGLDHAQTGETQLLAVRRIGRRIAFEYENPRFRATGAPPAEQAAARESFAFTTSWMGDIAATLPNGNLLVDIAGFLTRDALNVGQALKNGGEAGFRLADALSVADPAATRVFPDNVELEARQTWVSEAPGAEIGNIAPDPRMVSITLHHSFVRLPGPGYVPRRFDPRAGGFTAQAVDFAAPLGQPVVYDLAERFRLEKTDPAAARSRVKKPIVFYIDRAAPEPIRTALKEGVGWWASAFDAAGLIDAFRVEILPEGVDPLDVRYNVVNWVNRASRGWSYGQVIADPRTGEIVKGSVLLGSLRVRQDMLIFEALVGAAGVGTGGANDPVQVALARIRQLGAHEVGHALGFEHNFAASTQDRASVLDYPAPRIGLKDGAPDLSDAYGTGVGRWDRYTVAWLYGTDDEATARARAAKAQADGLRFVSDGDARAANTGQPWGSLWDDGADPAAELVRMLDVRRAAIARFGLPALLPGEQTANLRRKFVPIWLLHRYQVEAAAKLVGGVDFAYSVAGDGREAAHAVSGARQRQALDALMATLRPDALKVPPALLPLLSAGRSGGRDRQFDIEVMQSAGGPVFDPLVAADVAATVTLDPLFAADRLARLEAQHATDPALPGVDLVVTRALGDTLAAARDPVGQRVAWRTLVTVARVSRDSATAPGVAASLDAALMEAVARLARSKEPWAKATARLFGDNDRLTALLAEQARRAPKVPPGMPIGAEAEWMDDL